MGGKFIINCSAMARRKEGSINTPWYHTAERAVTMTAANTGQNVRTNNQLAATVEMV